MNVKFHNPEMPDGMEVDIGGLLLLNNKKMTVTDEEVEMFKTRNGETIKQRLGTNPFIEIDGKVGKVKYLTPDPESEDVSIPNPDEVGDN